MRAYFELLVIVAGALRRVIIIPSMATRLIVAALGYAVLLVFTSSAALGAESPNAWPTLNQAEQNAAIAQLKDYAQQTQSHLNIPLRSFETQYFLFCTGLGRNCSPRNHLAQAYAFGSIQLHRVSL